MKKFTIPEINYDMIFIEPGEFLMGRPIPCRLETKCLGWGWKERWIDWHNIDIEKQHKVKLSRGFFIGITVVTQNQWNIIMNCKPWVEGQKEFMELEKTKDFNKISWDNRLKFEELVERYLSILKSNNINTEKRKDQLRWLEDWLYYTGEDTKYFKFGRLDRHNNRFKSIQDLYQYDLTPFKFWLKSNEKYDHNSFCMSLSDKEVDDAILKVERFKEWLKINNIQYPEEREPVLYEAPKWITDEKDFPVTNITWINSSRFIDKLNEIHKIDVFRLPTEAEWEYACRAGSKSIFCYGDDENMLDNYAHYGEERYFNETGPKKVASKLPNDWGLYDVHGNVWEYCSDFFGPYNGDIYHTSIDPKGPLKAIKVIDRGDPDDDHYWRYDLGHVIRGGSWHSEAGDCTSGSRYYDHEHLRLYKSDDCGFRIVMQRK
jgi:formylglycine-generating enzyme required for sulfatase activity